MTLPVPPAPGPARRLAKRLAYGVVSRGGIAALLRRVFRDRLPILCYHSVVPEPPPQWVGRGGLHLGVERFARQIAWLARHYRVIPLAEAVAAIAAGRALPPRAAAITFDDGYVNNLEQAAPVLARHGLPATVFLATEYLGADGLYWWDELPALLTAGLGREWDVAGWGRLDLRSAAGVTTGLDLGAQRLRAAAPAARAAHLGALRAALGEPTMPVLRHLRPMRWDEARAAPDHLDFGGHGADHRVLDALEAREMADDLQRCRAALDRELGSRATALFCYPEGRWNEAVAAALGPAGFGAAVTATGRSEEEALVRAGEPLHRLPRIGVAAGMEVAVLEGNLAGIRALGRSRRD